VWDGVDSLQAVTDPDDPNFFVERKPYRLESQGSSLHMITMESSYAYDLVTWNGQRITGRDRWNLWGAGLRSWVPFTLGAVAGELWIGGRWGFTGDPAARTLARLDPGTSVPLPAIDLTARTTEEGVQLRWVTHHLPWIEGLTLEHARGEADWSRIWSGDQREGWLHRNPGPGVHRYRLIAESATGPVVSAEARIQVAPLAVRIHAAVPNPFNPTTQINFEIAEAGPVSLRVYDLAGRIVRTLVDESLTAGRHVKPWHGEDGRGRAAASGVYLIVLETHSGRDVRRVALVQ
jgi:hypothetical protein